MDPDSGAGLLHRLTSYTTDREWDVRPDDPRLRHDLQQNDEALRPPPIKDYPADLPRTPLPRRMPDVPVSATAVLAGHPAPEQPLDAAHLGRALFLGAGVVRTLTVGERTMLARASGSAGGRFPLEVYVSTRQVRDVPDGVHWYDPREHALVQVGPPAEGRATSLVVTGVPWRTGWRYAERGWRHLWWDGGTLAAQLQAAAASAGWRPRLRSTFPDRQVAELVGADGVHELPLYVLTLGDGEPAVRPGGRASAGSLPAVELPVVTQAHEAGVAGDWGGPWPDGAPLDAVPTSDPLDAVVRRRGSQRRMDRTGTVPRALLEWSMAAATRGIDVPHWVAVHGVDDVAPGLYRWPDLASPVRTGDLRDELERISLGQSLSAEAAFVAIAAVDGDELDDHGYREAQLAAGVVEGRLHLAAYALGASATGMTFLDSEVPELLGQPDRLVTLLLTCVGVPEYRSRPGGEPGAPTAVGLIQPRFAD